jgi:hypothetical protein
VTSAVDTFAIPVSIAHADATLTVDTGATVSILSISSFDYLCTLPGNAHFRAKLKPTNTSLTTVNGDKLRVAGCVALPVRLTAGTHSITIPFYVAHDYDLQSDGILGLHDMATNDLLIAPQFNSVIFSESCNPG